MATEGSAESRRGPGVLVLVVVLLLAAGGWVSWLGTRVPAPAAAQPSPGPARAEGPVASIELPHPDLELPPGPHRERFRVACTVCHSPRLALTQPGFPEKKWAEVVHKMVDVYGAALSPEEEREVAAYLAAVRGE
jgi:hypothetical protein